MEENKVGREKNFLEKQKRYIKLRLGLFGVLVKKENENIDDSGASLGRVNLILTYLIYLYLLS